MDAERRGLERVNESEAVGVITPKTDWKSTDFYNLEDHNRIVDNLNELLTRYELDSPIPHGVWGELLTADHRLAISGAYNRIIQTAGIRGPSTAATGGSTRKNLIGSNPLFWH